MDGSDPPSKRICLEQPQKKGLDSPTSSVKCASTTAQDASSASCIRDAESYKAATSGVISVVSNIAVSQSSLPPSSSSPISVETSSTLKDIGLDLDSNASCSSATRLVAATVVTSSTVTEVPDISPESNGCSALTVTEADSSSELQLPSLSMKQKKSTYALEGGTSQLDKKSSLLAFETEKTPEQLPKVENKSSVIIVNADELASSGTCDTSGVAVCKSTSLSSAGDEIMILDTSCIVTTSSAQIMAHSLTEEFNKSGNDSNQDEEVASSDQLVSEAILPSASSASEVILKKKSQIHSSGQGESLIISDAEVKPLASAAEALQQSHSASDFLPEEASVQQPIFVQASRGSLSQLETGNADPIIEEPVAHNKLHSSAGLDIVQLALTCSSIESIEMDDIQSDSSLAVVNSTEEPLSITSCHPIIVQATSSQNKLSNSTMPASSIESQCEGKFPIKISADEAKSAVCKSKTSDTKIKKCGLSSTSINCEGMVNELAQLHPSMDNTQCGESEAKSIQTVEESSTTIVKEDENIFIKSTEIEPMDLGAELTAEKSSIVIEEKMEGDDEPITIISAESIITEDNASSEKSMKGSPVNQGSDPSIFLDEESCENILRKPEPVTNIREETLAGDPRFDVPDSVTSNSPAGEVLMEEDQTMTSIDASLSTKDRAEEDDNEDDDDEGETIIKKTPKKRKKTRRSIYYRPRPDRKKKEQEKASTATTDVLTEATSAIASCNFAITDAVSENASSIAASSIAVSSTATSSTATSSVAASDTSDAISTVKLGSESAGAIPSPVIPVDEDSQGSSSNKEKKEVRRFRCEVVVPESTEAFTADKIMEYVWPLEGGYGEQYFIQEHISQYIGISSFKRKYPDLRRRNIDMAERDYLKEQGLVTEIACDMGLMAVRSEDVMDILFADFPVKFEELTRTLSERRDNQLKERGRVEYQVADIDKSKLQEYGRRAAEEAARWNAAFNREKKEERRYSFDLQTFTLQYPIGLGKRLPPHLTKIGNYPVAVLPGQYTDKYKRYTYEELNRLPLNTVCTNMLEGDASAEEQLIPIASSENSVLDRPDDKGATQALLVATQMKRETGAPAGEKILKCKVCSGGKENNKNGKSEGLIVCAKCSSASHASCVDLNPSMIPRINSYGWQCMECKNCMQCSGTDDEDKMIFCDLCDRGFHTYCVGLRRIPHGRWHCKECAVCNTCGITTPNGGESIKNAEWQHEFRKNRDNNKISYATTLCVPCDRLWKRRQYCYVCLKVYRSIAEDNMVRCANCPKYIHRENEGCTAVFEGEYLCIPCFKSSNTTMLNHNRIIAAAKKKMASGY